MIYADNAATTQLDRDAFEYMSCYLLDDYGNASQPYSFSRKVKQALKHSREVIANCLCTQPEEIYFTSCGTESDNWAVKMAAYGGGDIITSEIEHHAVLSSCEALRQGGSKVIYLPVNESGEVGTEVLRNAISDTTKLVSIMYANNEIGTIQPIKKLAEIAHEKGCLFHTDAVQAVGHIDLNITDLNVDMLSASAHKFNGPKGIGFLYIKNGTVIQSFMSGGGQERKLRAGTENIAAIVAMAVALNNNIQQIERNKKHLLELESELVGRLKMAEIDFMQNGGSNKVPGNISLSFANSEGEMLLHRLDLQGICISTGSACDGMDTQVSHVIKALHIPEKYAKGTIRVSFGKNNTKDEAIEIAETLIKILKK